MKTHVTSITGQELEIFWKEGFSSTVPLNPDDSVERWGPIIEQVKDENGIEVQLEPEDLESIAEEIESSIEIGLTYEIEMQL